MNYIAIFFIVLVALIMIFLYGFYLSIKSFDLGYKQGYEDGINDSEALNDKDE